MGVISTSYNMSYPAAGNSSKEELSSLFQGFLRTPKIIPKAMLEGNLPNSWYAPAGIRTIGPTPTYPSLQSMSYSIGDNYYSLMLNLVRVATCKWKINILTFEDMIEMHQFGIQHHFTKEKNSQNEDEVFLIFDSESDEVQYRMFIEKKT